MQNKAMISTMVEYKDRLAEAMKGAGKKTQALADHLGLSYQAVRKVLIGETNAFTASNNNKAAGYLGVNPVWLSDGAGPRNAPTASNHGNIELPEGAIKVASKPRRIWVVGKGAGGLSERIWDDGDYPVGATEDYTTDINSPDPQAFLVAVDGPSMWPKYEDGNFALIEPTTEPELEDVVLVRLRTGETMLKRLLSRRGKYRFGSYNDPQIHEYRPEEVSWIYYAAHEVPRRRIKSRNGGVL